MAYQTVIGLEMHCEMKSHSKVFSPSINSFSKNANTNISEIDLAFPGILPTLNMECVKKAIMAAMILNCKIPKYMEFDRKNYYYPDLPKGYQITQNTSPVGIKGNIDIEVGENIKNVLISDIHLEEDTASLDHLDTISLIDYNRAGIPLLECVTEPCLYSADEAVAFIESMCNIYRYTDISDADTKKGQIRCDVNINLMDENGAYVTPKVEVKNVNSISNVKATILYEEKRQLEALNNGETLLQETRRFDETNNITVHMRSKEDAVDYKYFIEPNILPFEITNDLLLSIKQNIPKLALERKTKYLNEYKIDKEKANTIIKNINIADYFEECVNIGIDSVIAANYVTGVISAYLYSENLSITDFYLKPSFLKEIIDAQTSGLISSKQAKEIFYKSLEENKEPKNFISNENSQLNDGEEIEKIINSILENCPKQIEEYKNGKTNMFDFFVGQVMKETKGKANPMLTKDILHNKIDK